MKHLGVLEDAGLITTRKRGREKSHYLNAVPIRLVHDKYVVVNGAGTMTVFEIYIKTTPERLWEAIVDERPCWRPANCSPRRAPCAIRRLVA